MNLVQRRSYPPPKGASDLQGSGTGEVVAKAAQNLWAVGDKICGLTNGVVILEPSLLMPHTACQFPQHQPDRCCWLARNIFYRMEQCFFQPKTANKWQFSCSWRRRGHWINSNTARCRNGFVSIHNRSRCCVQRYYRHSVRNGQLALMMRICEHFAGGRWG